MKEPITITEVAFHRNGVGGACFHVVSFLQQREGQPVPERMVGIVFDEPHHVAVLSVDKLNDDVIGFGWNSWRGDVYEEELRKAIDENPSLIVSSKPEDNE